MADIELKIKHKHSKQEIKKRLQEKIDAFANQLYIDSTWENDTLIFSGSAKGSLTIEDEDLLISLDLSFAAKLMKSGIEARLQDGLEKMLA